MKTNWQTKKLGEICDLVKGKKPKIFVSKSSKPYLTAKVIRKTKKPKFAAENCPLSVWVKKENIVIIMDGSNSGELFTGLKGALASTMGIIKYSKDLLIPRYLLYFLVIQRENFTKSRTGAAIPHLNKEEFENLEILFPSLPEQRRIVKIIDKVFEKTAKAKENAEKNLQNSKELFESYLQSVFANPGKDWEEKRLEELGKITSSKRIFKREYVKSGIPFYRIKEVKELANNKRISTDLYITESRYSKIKDSFDVPREGDLLMTAVGTIGEIYVVKKDDVFYFKDGNILWFKNFDSINPYFLKLVLLSFVEKIKRLSVGSAYNALTIEKLEKHKIFIPPFSKQKSIVKKLDTLSAKTKKLESIYQQKVSDLEELKKSVLKKAFVGEL